jgi:hypothetical protein
VLKYESNSDPRQKCANQLKKQILLFSINADVLLPEEIKMKSKKYLRWAKCLLATWFFLFSLNVTWANTWPNERGVSATLVDDDTYSINDTSSIKRVALVIGNGDYQNLPKLRNPVNDAKGMKEALNKRGFKVILVGDANKQAMKKAIRRFKTVLQQGSEIGLFFYAGHGLEVGGHNYLLAIDANIQNEDNIKEGCHGANRVIMAIHGHDDICPL